MYRKISTDLWGDPKVEELSMEATYLWLYLLTSPRGNLVGCYEITRKRIARDAKMDDDTVGKAVKELALSNVIDYDAATNEVLVKNWRKYNWTKSPKLAKSLVEGIETVKSPNFRAFLANAYEEWFGTPYEYSIDTVYKPYAYDSVSVSVSVKEDVTGENPTGKGYQVGTRRKHGEFSNVLLTDEELSKLKEKFPDDWRRRIDDLSYYIGSTGKKYKSHYRTILSWDRKNKPAGKEERYAKYD